MKFVHKIDPSLLSRVVRVAVIGAGGTGSNLVPRLAQLDHAMKELGHPGGLDVVVIDDDLVSKANVGRQIFYDSDIGLSKAAVLVNRINLHFRTNWTANASKLTGQSSLHTDIVIGCVDTRKARAAILKACKKGAYWLDCGNNVDSGQVVLGQVAGSAAHKSSERLPTVADLFPELVDPTKDSADDGPSCSLEEALRKQSLVVNPTMAMEAFNLLWMLFRHGELKYSGKFVNLASGVSTPIRIDTDVWARMGYHAPQPKKRKVKDKKEMPKD